MGSTETTIPPEPGAAPDAATPVSGPTEECHPACTISSQTRKRSPADRTRTKVGVGEEVTITVTGNPATWDISGGGTISPATGTQANVTYTADVVAGSATVTATGSGCSCVNTITFSVVEPSHFTMRRKGSTLEHTNPWPDCGWTGLIYVHPDDVNFYRVQVREIDSQAVTTGCYNLWSGIYHGNYPAPDRVSAWLSLTSHSERRGTKSSGEDHIYSGRPTGSWSGGGNPPFVEGRMHFPMTWQWRVLGNHTSHNFPQFRQSHRVSGAGRCTSSKAGNTERCLFSDPTSARA